MKSIIWKLEELIWWMEDWIWAFIPTAVAIIVMCLFFQVNKGVIAVLAILALFSLFIYLVAPED